jgi:hypothetical protein
LRCRPTHFRAHFEKHALGAPARDKSLGGRYGIVFRRVGYIHHRVKEQFEFGRGFIGNMWQV